MWLKYSTNMVMRSRGLNTVIASIQPGQPVIHSVELPTRSQVTSRT
jgi:hypothetical protein